MSRSAAAACFRSDGIIAAGWTNVVAAVSRSTPSASVAAATARSTPTATAVDVSSCASSSRRDVSSQAIVARSKLPR